MHNLKIASETMLLIHEKGFDSVFELEQELKELSFDSTELKKEFSAKKFEQKRIKEIVKDLQKCLSKKLIMLVTRKILTIKFIES